ncbi:hypothetical protein C8R42DRAFT_269446 [Lentinula raphanica]|nr:hypothetical protein C8R42DRAFT_269446 [Lentinula raphanica]
MFTTETMNLVNNACGSNDCKCTSTRTNATVARSKPTTSSIIRSDVNCTERAYIAVTHMHIEPL